MSDQSNTSEARKGLLDEKRNVTTRISETCRFIGYGLLAVYYAMWFGEKGTTGVFESGTIYVVGVAGALTVVFDYAQYLAGAKAVERALESADGEYHTEWYSYRMRRLFFVVKQWTAGIGAAAIVILMVFHPK